VEGWCQSHSRHHPLRILGLNKLPVASYQLPVYDRKCVRHDYPAPSSYNGGLEPMSLTTGN
jgi:hypothetical protein